jgi:hypothetical protein
LRRIESVLIEVHWGAMGEVADRSDPPTAQDESEDLKNERAPKPTVKGMVPLQRAPAPVEPTEK